MMKVQDPPNLATASAIRSPRDRSLEFWDGSLDFWNNPGLPVGYFQNLESQIIPFLVAQDHARVQFHCHFPAYNPDLRRIGGTSLQDQIVPIVLIRHYRPRSEEH